ncbi:hypothetical protein FSP39_024602 [Pinctada imbricata]|uniref:Uncharacterized protein n=1 Tax=Pinctada imbricata TaxID=66713 RepID=A0AA88YKD5_PINIB|nr:hypothetical protein FSP39_024602 [Pinctada imbricata]
MPTPSLKRKQADSITPPQDQRFIRRRFRSASMSDLPKSCDTNAVATDVDHQSNDPDSNISNIDTGSDLLSVSNVSELITNTLSQDQFVSSLLSNLVPILTPVLSNALSPMLSAAVNAAVESATKPLEEKIRDQGAQIDAYEQRIGYLMSENEKMFNCIAQLEEVTEELEQYGRRNSLRFHNVELPPDSDSTDAADASVVRS